MLTVIIACDRCLTLREIPWRRRDVPTSGRALCLACGDFGPATVLGVVRRAVEPVPPVAPQGDDALDELTEEALDELIRDALHEEGS